MNTAKNNSRISLFSRIQNIQLFKLLALSSYAKRASAAGLDPMLVARGKLLGALTMLEKGRAFFNDLARLHRKDYTTVSVIVQHISAAEINRLVDLYPDIIEKEIEATGDSAIFRKQLQAGMHGLDSPALHSYVHARIKRAIAIRKGKSKSRDIKFDRSRALDVLLLLKQKFAERNVRIFLSSGTLLGAVRENGFVANDYDIDVGAFASELSPEQCAEIFRGTEFNVVSVTKEFVVLYHYPTQISIDVFFYFNESGLVHYGTVIHRWWHEPFELVPYSLQGHEFFIPANVEAHLTERYGNWKTPVLFYDLSYDGPDRTYSPTLEALLYLHARAEKAVSKSWRFYADQPLAALKRDFGVDCTDLVPRAVNKSSLPLPLNPAFTKGKRVVLMIGAFLKFDIATLRTLESAAQQGDVLVVGLVPETLMVAPGPGPGAEPLPPVRRRLEVLRSLKSVANAVAFESVEAATDYIANLKPATVILESGPRYERELVEALSDAVWSEAPPAGRAETEHHPAPQPIALAAQ